MARQSSVQKGLPVSWKTTIVLVVLFSATALVHGRLTDRWGVPTEVSKAAARLNEIPAEITGWHSTDFPVSPRVVVAAGAENILDREYTSDVGDRIRVMVVCGRPGPVSRHPPTVCFASAGLRQVTEESIVECRVQSDLAPAKFAKCQFVAENSASNIDTQWSFSTNGREWQKPSDPRFAYAGHGWLYKLYIISVETNDERTIASREAFTQQLLTELSTTLM